MSWLSDLIDRGEQVIFDSARQAFSQRGTSAHIPAQNQVNYDFEIEALTPFRAGRLTAQQAIAKIQQLDAGFSSYAQGLGYTRALQGAADVHTLAVRLINDLRAAGASAPGGIVPPSITNALGNTDWVTLAAVGVGVYLLSRR